MNNFEIIIRHNCNDDATILEHNTIVIAIINKIKLKNDSFCYELVMKLPSTYTPDVYYKHYDDAIATFKKKSEEWLCRFNNLRNVELSLVPINTINKQ